jgi:hypothetical protein
MERLRIRPQPTDTACGPTCLEAVYRYFGDPAEVETIITEVANVKRGGTLAVVLGIHALKRGYNARIYTYNLHVFDPTWFRPKRLSTEELKEKLLLQIEAKTSQKLRFACKHYLDFLSLGGEIVMEDICHRLITKYLKKGIPILTGLSSTYLYMTTREYVLEDTSQQIVDDVKGYPEGHFVLIHSYDTQTQMVTLMDPYEKNPYSKELKYTISLDHLQTAIMLGVLTYDANMLMISKSD